MNTLLIGKAEVLPAIREDIQRMVDNPGIWIVTDENHLGAEIPVVSRAGKLYAIELSTELAPERFLSTARKPMPELTNDAGTGAEPQVRSSELLAAALDETNAYAAKALQGITLGPEWQAVIGLLVRTAFQDGFLAGASCCEKLKAANGQAQRPPR